MIRRTLLLVLLLAPLSLARADMYPDASNAVMPQAKENLLYTPARCDGFSAADGAMTSGSATLTSASAAFTAADTGKKVTVRGAGAKFFANAAAVSAGGAGHGVGDLVNFANGIQIFVMSVSGGAVANFYVVNRGSSTTNPGTLAQTSSVKAGSTIASPVAGGTGAVIAPTWVRENLVTTIASGSSGTSANLAQSAAATVSGAIWGYGSDYSAQIQAALNAGTPVQLPSGICGQGSTLTMGDADVLLGQSLAQGKLGTTLMWLGAPNNPQVFIGTQAGVRASNVRVGLFRLDGLGAASKGYYMRGVNGTTVHVTEFNNHSTVGLDIHGNDNTITSINNYFEHLTFSYTDPGADAPAQGIWWGFPNTYNTGADNALSQYSLVEIKTLPTAPGFICGAADHNTVVYMQTRAGTEPQIPPGIEMLGSNWSALGHCRDNQFVGMDAGNGGLQVRATGWARLPENSVDFYDQGNGGADYAVESGGRLYVRSSGGRFGGFTVKPAIFDKQQVTREGAISVITDSTTQIPGDRVLVGGGSYRIPAYNDGIDWRVMAPVTRAVTKNNSPPQNPTGTTNTAAFEMMGLGATGSVMTPNLSGIVLFSMSGTIANSAAGGGARIRMRYGSGTAPANGAAETGTAACNSNAEQHTELMAANQKVPFNLLCMIAGLTPGTAYWFDIATSALVAGTATISGVTSQGLEQ